MHSDSGCPGGYGGYRRRLLLEYALCLLYAELQDTTRLCETVRSDFEFEMSRRVRCCLESTCVDVE